LRNTGGFQAEDTELPMLDRRARRFCRNILRQEAIGMKAVVAQYHYGCVGTG
jgi:hypothetical protein